MSRVVAIVLSAGRSSRMGHPKALVKVRNDEAREVRFIDHILGAAKGGGCDDVLVVLGAPHADEIRQALPKEVLVALNPAPDRGMLSSIQCGIAALLGQVDSALVWPVDVPLVRAKTVQRILAEPADLVVPCHQGRGGHPVKIGCAHFSRTLALWPEEPRGFRAITHAALRIEVNDAGVLRDFDTPESLA